MTDYRQFLNSKRFTFEPDGFKGEISVNPVAFDFQRDIIQWALKRGRACIFADCGMGKTLMQLEWAKHISLLGKVIILCPLAVAEQTVAEGIKFGVDVKYCRSQSEVTGQITITNYQMLEHFDLSQFIGIVIDESSIVKHYDGKFRNLIISCAKDIPYRLACTATPAPNDFMELGNHAEFVGAMTRTEMLSMFFVHDGGETQKWRLKGHAQGEFWKWVCEWAVMIRKPSDLGYPDGDFILPPCNIHDIRVDADWSSDTLFPMEALTLQERIGARRNSIDARVRRTAALVASKLNEPWLIWCNLNNEADALEKMIPGAVQCSGSEDPETKANKLLAFSRGEILKLITKPSIAGFGLNFQHCSEMAYVGLSDSFEQLYQSKRRCWRFGQKKPVNVYIVTSTAEGQVVANIKRKERDADEMAMQMVSHMSAINQEQIKGTIRKRNEYKMKFRVEENWQMYLGDCVEHTSIIGDNSIGLSVFSPPFASLYTYSASERDMGNCTDHKQFFDHFKYLIKELYRVLIPGRHVDFHCMQLPTSKARDGVIGLTDFRGMLIREFEKAGFIYHSEACIWKDPVTAMQRTKALGLLWKQLKKDSTMSRCGIADYLITMRKPGTNPFPVEHKPDDFPVDRWQQWASPVWMDIDPSDTLQARSCREHDDERHLCALQLEVIRRSIVMRSREGETVFSPFGGIGSEGYVALELGRKFIGIELKESYYNQACANLETVEDKKKERMLIAV